MKSVDSKFVHDITCKAFIWVTANLPEPLLYLVDWIVFFKKKISPIPEIPEWLCKNPEWDHGLDIDITSFSEKKKLGISGIMRIRNGDDFMEPVIESHLELCDEIIILENQSTDKTAEIAKRLKQKYPDRIQYFEWDHEIYRCFTKEFSECPGNSVQSFAYYTNFGYSKARYQYVMKVDDDDLWIPKFAHEVRKYVMEKQPKKAIYYYGINLMEVDGKIGVPKFNPYLGKNGDHIIYPISSRTYCLQSYGAEIFVQPYRWYRYGFSCLHLKHLKKEYGFTNYPEPKKTEWTQYVLNAGIEEDFSKYDKKASAELVFSTLKRFGITGGK